MSHTLNHLTSVPPAELQPRDNWESQDEVFRSFSIQNSSSDWLRSATDWFRSVESDDELFNVI